MAMQALAMPTDDTALREYCEEYLNASEEIKMLNRIYMTFLDDLDYKGDIVDGIKAALKAAKREALLEAADAMEAGAFNTPYGLRRMAGEIE
jgi:hypothetical protein